MCFIHILSMPNENMIMDTKLQKYILLIIYIIKIKLIILLLVTQRINQMSQLI